MYTVDEALRETCSKAIQERLPGGSRQSRMRRRYWSSTGATELSNELVQGFPILRVRQVSISQVVKVRFSCRNSGAERPLAEQEVPPFGHAAVMGVGTSTLLSCAGNPVYTVPSTKERLVRGSAGRQQMRTVRGPTRLQIPC